MDEDPDIELRLYRSAQADLDPHAMPDTSGDRDLTALIEQVIANGKNPKRVVTTAAPHHRTCRIPHRTQPLNPH